MASLNERLGKLEAASPPERSRGESIAEQEKRAWLVRAGIRRHRDRDRDEDLARDIINLLRLQGRLPTDADGLRDRLLAWTPPLDPAAVERAVEKAIFEAEPGLEGMEPDPEWTSAFEARDLLRERYASVPAEVHARLTLEAADDNAEECEEAEALGLTGELHLLAAGPDAEDISEDNLHRRLRQILDEDSYGLRAYEIARHIARLQMKETT